MESDYHESAIVEERSKYEWRPRDVVILESDDASGDEESLP